MHNDCTKNSIKVSDDCSSAYFSLDCIKWGLIQLPEEETRKRCLLIKGRFIGDPSHEYEYIEKKPEVDEMEQEDDDNTNMVCHLVEMIIYLHQSMNRHGL